ncbi:MAG TPA: hypothetical protein VG186_14005 [Solirubrobacteraceae bacterium]|jgi:hypothetical protein|nr:hypothetical protein [Solirubrobacteraceae bacterium]
MSDENKNCQRVDGEAAFEYLRDNLWLARELGSYLEEIIHLDALLAYTIADPEIPGDRVTRFTEGGRVYSGDVWHAVWRSVADRMDRHRPAVWLVPDSLARPTDLIPIRNDVDAEHYVVGDGIYYVERRPDAERVGATWRRAKSAAGEIGVVTTHLSDGLRSSADLRLAAVNYQFVVVTAYDGDGALLLGRTA